MEKVFEVENPPESETCLKTKRQKVEGNPTTDWYVCVSYPRIMRYWCVQIEGVINKSNIELP